MSDTIPRGKKMPNSTIAVLAMLTYLFTSCLAHAADLEVRLSVVQDAILVHEPLVLRITVRNTGEAPLSVPNRLSPYTSTAEFLVSKEGLPYESSSAGSVRDPTGDIVISPNEKSVFEELICVDWKNQENVSLFADAGSYKVKARLLIGERMYETAAVPFSVQKPEGDVSAEVLRSGALDIHLLAMFETQVAVVDSFDELELLSDTGSRYAPYASLLLAKMRMLSIEGRNIRPGHRHKISDEDIALLLENIDMSAQESFSLRSEALALKREWMIYIGNSHEAESLRRTIVTEYPDSAAASRLAPN